MSRLAPDVSVVIPTLGRPRLLSRALNSVLAQTYRDFEVVVVVDGPDEETVAALRALSDPRVRVLVNPRSLTAAGARNLGAEHARGEWIAFLDDDDEWLPHKLERQMGLPRPPGPVLVTSLSRIVTPIATYVWPTAIFDNARPLGEYLFDRRSLFAGGAFIQTSSYLLPRALFLRSPFRLGTPHDDWDFLLRLSKQAGARVETVPDVLVNVYFEERRPSLSHADGWAASLAWLDDVQPMLTPRAYSGFCLAVVGPRAADQHAYAAFFPLLVKAFRNGAPRGLHVLAFLAFWLVPRDRRRRLRKLLARRPAAPEGAAAGT
jgi:glycosyltransferase involved in cell wall biosynthesis